MRDTKRITATVYMLQENRNSKAIARRFTRTLMGSGRCTPPTHLRWWAFGYGSIQRRWKWFQNLGLRRRSRHGSPEKRRIHRACEHFAEVNNADIPCLMGVLRPPLEASLATLGFLTDNNVTSNLADADLTTRK